MSEGFVSRGFAVRRRRTEGGNAWVAFAYEG